MPTDLTATTAAKTAARTALASGRRSAAGRPSTRPATTGTEMPDRPVRLNRRLSGLKPTGRLHIGNYLGAIRPMIDLQESVDSLVMVVDLHALTVEHDPARLRQLTFEMLATSLAAGVDPQQSLCFLQSDVPEHAELHYLLECATG
ncbi:MAG TPA: hypothetical protein VF163_16500, partial [Micromonosporaceae bacterium]